MMEALRMSSYLFALLAQLLAANNTNYTTVIEIFCAFAIISHLEYLNHSFWQRIKLDNLLA